jgi:hypothetical protein
LESLGGRDYWEDLDVDARKVDTQEIGFEGVNWINLAEYNDSLQAVVYKVTNSQVP